MEYERVIKDSTVFKICPGVVEVSSNMVISQTNTLASIRIEDIAFMEQIQGGGELKLFSKHINDHLLIRQDSEDCKKQIIEIFRLVSKYMSQRSNEKIPC